MHIKDIVDYVKREIHFSKEFCEDNVFVTLRIEPIERIIENLEQKDKDNTSYAQDLAEAEFKANKYDALVEKIKEKIEKRKQKYNEILSDYGNIDTDAIFNISNANVRKSLDELSMEITILQEILDTEKEE